MEIVVNETTAVLPAALRTALEAVSFPTIGHYLEEGFVEPGIRRQVATGGRVIGTAVTVRTTALDSTAVHHAAGMILPGQVLVIDTGGDRIHAPLGEVVATQLKVRGAAGAVVDGVVTDLDELEAIGLPVYARGTSMLTTKHLKCGGGGIGVPVVCGGVGILPGHVILGDRNGLLALESSALEAILDVALEDDASEPELLRQIENGGLLGELSGATASIAEMQRA